MILGLALVVAVLGICMSLARLHRVVSPVYLHPGELAKAIETGKIDLAGVAARLPAESTADWDRELLAARDLPPETRVGATSELLMDADARLDGWRAAPRTFARLGSLGGFLVASVIVRQALDRPRGEGEAVADVFQGAMASAIGAMLAGFALTAFCVAVHSEARRRTRAIRSEFETLIDIALSEVPSTSVEVVESRISAPPP